MSGLFGERRMRRPAPPEHEKSNSINDSGYALNQRPPAHLAERQLIEF